MTLKDDLNTLDRLTDAEADNLRTAQRQGDLPESLPFTWAVVLDSWRQMPEDIQTSFGDPQAITEALGRVLALVGEGRSVVATYDLPDYGALGQTDEEIALLVKHDIGEELHAFVTANLNPEDMPSPPGFCSECEDDSSGLMHNNTWRNIEPLMQDLSDLDAEGIKARQGWNDSTFLDLALEYIDNQQDNEAWVDFLREKADQEIDHDMSAAEYQRDQAERSGNSSANWGFPVGP